MKKTIQLLTLTCVLFSAPTFSTKKQPCYVDYLPNEILGLIFQEALKNYRTEKEYYKIRHSFAVVSKRFNQIAKGAFSDLCKQLAKTIDTEKLDKTTTKIFPGFTCSAKQLDKIRTINTLIGNGTDEFTEKEQSLSGEIILNLLLQGRHPEYFFVLESIETRCPYVLWAQRLKISEWLAKEKKQREIKKETLDALEKLLFYFTPYYKLKT